MIRLLCVVLSAFVLMAVIGCSQYVDGYNYGPRPVTAQIPATQPQDPPPVTAMASVIGVRYDDQQDQIPPSIEIRLNVENTGRDAVVLDPASMELSTGTLMKFAPAIVRPPTPITIGPDQAADLTAYFPFPGGTSYDSTDLGTLRLRWRLQIGERQAGQMVYFNRIPTVYYDSYPYGYYGPPPPIFWWGPPVVIVHGRWR